MKHIFVSGASTGIGFSISKELANNFHVHASVRKNHDADRLKELNPNINVYFMDVTKHDEVDSVAKQLSERLGKEKLSVLINNAGIASAGPLEHINIEDVRKGLEVNVLGSLKVSQVMIPLLNENDSKIINMSSKSGRTAFPFTGAYAASKFGLEAISDAMRRELSGTGIKIVLVEPGAVKTPIWDKADTINLEQYRGTRYEHIMESIKSEVIKAGREGADPDQLATLIRKIIETEKPKLRYIFAKKPFKEIKRIQLLPDRWLDSLIRKRLFG